MANKKNKYHYFYKITNNLNGHFYYGVHNTNDLNDGYMGSGTRLHYAYKKYGIENFSKEILKYFNSSKEAFEYEAEIVNEDLIKDNNCYNIKQGGDGWQTIGLVTVKDKNSNYFDVLKDDERLKTGELVGITKGLFTAKDKNGNYFKISKDDPKYLSGELVGYAKNLAPYKDKNGKYILCSSNDIRVLNGDLTFITKNKVLVKDKNNKFYWVDYNDERLLSKQLIPWFTNKKHSIVTREKMSNSHKKNNDQVGEKNSQYGTCWITKDNKNKKIKKEELEQYINLGWSKGRFIK